MTPLAWARARNADRTLPAIASLKQVRLELALHSSPNGISWPSIGRLVERTSLGERTIRRALRLMEQLGELATEVRRGRSCTSLYRLQLPAAATCPAPEAQLDLQLAAAEKPATATEKPAMVAPKYPEEERFKSTSLRDAQPANSVVIESRIEAEATPPLGAIEAEAVPPLGRVLNEIPAPRKRVWLHGVPIVRGLLGVSERQARAFLGGMLKASRDDCAAVLAVLEEAADLRPIEPKSWLMAAARERGTPAESQRTRLMRDLRAEFGVPQPTVFERAPSFLEYMQ